MSFTGYWFQSLGGYSSPLNSFMTSDLWFQTSALKCLFFANNFIPSKPVMSPILTFTILV